MATCAHCGRTGPRGFEAIAGGMQCVNAKACGERVRENVRASQRFQRRNYGTGHGYTLDRKKIPGVTTVKNMKASPGLTGWAARAAADYVLDEWGEIVAMAPSQRHKMISTAHDRARNQASTRGTRIHALGEKVAYGEPVEVPDELRGPVEAYARFLDQWQIEALHTEIPCCNTTYRYGGTADVIGTSALPRMVDMLEGLPFMLDVKSGNAVYRETALQLAGYRHCDLALIDGLEVAMPETSPKSFVAHVTPDGVEMLPVDAGQSSFSAFLYLLGVYRWDQACWDDPPIGRAIWPETIEASA